VVPEYTAAFPDARHDITDVNQHVATPYEVNATGSDWELLDIALDELDSWAAVLIQERTTERRQNYINSDCTTIKSLAELNTVVTPAASDVHYYGIPAEPRSSGDIQEKSPRTRRETSVQKRELVAMGSP
jgi:hypothetical protein